MANRGYENALFVFSNPSTHLWTRGIAGFIVAPYLIYAGKIYSDPLLILFGVSTLIFDTVTFFMSLKQLENRY